VLVDDGLATGATMKAAVRALRQRGAKRIIVAVPVGAAETCQHFESEVDEIICGKKPADLGAVGMWYEDFTQTTDEEGSQLLEQTTVSV
jgi:putative phosphoribosyl transferase